METKKSKQRGDSRKLTPEERKAIAAEGGKKRWENARKKKEAEAQAESIASGPPAIVPAPPAPIQEPPRRVKDDPVPKVFGKALAEAEKQLSKHLEEISYHEQLLAMKKARLPFLVQTIKALGGTINPEQVAGQMDPYMTAMIRGEQFVPVPRNQPASDNNIPPVPIARGGALGVIDDGRGQDDEDRYLKGDELTGGTGWA